MLQSKDEIMARQLKQTVDDIKEYSRGKQGLKAIIVLRIIATALITVIFTASEVIRIVCRKDQGKEEISYIRLGISVIAFLGYGIAIIISRNAIIDMRFYGSIAFTGLIVILAGGFYIIFGILVFALGMSSKSHSEESSRTKIAPDHPGDSVLFSSVHLTNTSLARIRNLYEPLVFLITGILLGLLNPFAGLPLVVCAISYWTGLVIDISRGTERDRKYAILKYKDHLKAPLMEVIGGRSAKNRLFSIRIFFFEG